MARHRRQQRRRQRRGAWRPGVRAEVVRLYSVSRWRPWGHETHRVAEALARVLGEGDAHDVWLGGRGAR